MEVNFWGVRGSVPSPEPAAWRYGSNTPCVTVRAGGRLFILDAGTGIRDLGRQLLAHASPPGVEAYLLLSHYHWDHVQGLPFFEPLYHQTTTLHFLGPHPPPGVPSTLAGILNILFRSPFFPVTVNELTAVYTLRELDWTTDYALGLTRLRTCRLNHPQGSIAFRLEHDGVSVVYASDHEPGNPECDRAVRELAQGADLLIADAQYYPEELQNGRRGWGHSSWASAAVLAAEARVKRLVLFHHDPARSDDEIDRTLIQARSVFPATWAASEGMHMNLTTGESRVGSRRHRLGQRTRVHLPVQVETSREGNWVQEEAQLETLSLQGAYFLSQRAYEPRQSVEVAVPLRLSGNGLSGKRPAAPEDVLRLRGTVLRSDPQTTNGGWNGVAVHFPGFEAPET